MRDWVKTEYTPEQQAFNLEQERQQAFLEEAGIEDMDASKLRKTMLSAEEAQIAKQEQLEDIRIRKCRKPDWDEYVDAKRRWGKALHHSDIIARFRQLVPNLYVDDGTIRNTLSLYTWDQTYPFKDKIGGTVYLGWLHMGWNPEYEIDIPNDVGIAIKQLRGWRTTLKNLICRRDPVTFESKSLCTEEQAYEMFGWPTNGNTASNYRMYLHKFRNTSPKRARLEHALMEAAAKYRYA